MEKGSYRKMCCPAPCILSLAGPIKGGAGDRVLRTLGLSCYTVILALMLAGTLREGNMAIQLGEGGIGIPQTPPSALGHSESANVLTVPVGLSSSSSDGVGTGEQVRFLTGYPALDHRD